MKIRELTNMVGSGIFIEVQIMSNGDEIYIEATFERKLVR